MEELYQITRRENPQEVYFFATSWQEALGFATNMYGKDYMSLGKSESDLVDNSIYTIA